MLFSCFSKSLIIIFIKSLIVQLDHRYVELQSVFYVCQTHQREHTTLSHPGRGPEIRLKGATMNTFVGQHHQIGGVLREFNTEKMAKNVTLMGLNDLCLIYNRS